MASIATTSSALTHHGARIGKLRNRSSATTQKGCTNRANGQKKVDVHFAVGKHLYQAAPDVTVLE